MRFPLAGLSPFGPIFGKELRVTARRRRTYFLRSFYIGVLLLLLLLGYAATVDRYSSSSASIAYQQQAQLGQVFFATFAMFCLTMMGAIGPLLTCSAISSERLGKTLPVLLMTPISAWQIVAGKLCSRLFIALTLIGLSLPALAVVRLLGGVQLDQTVAALSLCAAMALFSAAMGLWLSCIVNRPYAVILAAYVLLAALYLLVPFAAYVLVYDNLNTGNRLFEQHLSATNPFFAMGMILEGSRRTVHWPVCALVHIGLSFVLTVAAARRLRATQQPPVRDEEEAPMTDAADTNLSGDVAAAAPGGESRGRSRKRSSRFPAVRMLDNPVLWRELRQRLVTRRGYRIAAWLIAIGLFGLLYVALAEAEAFTESDAQIPFAMVMHGLLILMSCVLSATAISQERESDTWTILLATPIRGWAIVWGKFVGVWRRMAWPLGMFAGHFGLFVVVGAIDVAQALNVIWVFVAFNTIFVASGVLFSLLLRRPLVAVVLNLSLPVLAYAIAPIALLGLGVWLADSYDWAEAVLYYLPFFYIVQDLDRSALSTRWMPFGSVPRWDFYQYSLTAGVVYILSAWGVLLVAARKFDRFVGRASQRDPMPLPQDPGTVAAAV